jgi:signal transduction histidine kinase/CheY-like chemotaxis protein
VLPEDIPNVIKQQRKHILGEADFYESFYRRKHKDGHLIWCYGRGKIIEFDEDNKPKRMIGITQDLSNIQNSDEKITLVRNEKNNLCLVDETNDNAIDQNVMLWEVNEIARIILSYDESQPFNEILHKSLELIGETTNLDSAYIWKDQYENNELTCVKVYEWVEGMDSISNYNGLETIPYSRMPSIKKALDSGKCFNDFTENMTPSEKKILEPRGIKALLVAPINLSDKRWGFIGVDNYKSKRHFSRLEENLLLMSGFLLANSIQKRMDQAEMKEAEERMQIVLNATPLCCNFFDKNFRLLLCNDECVRLFGLGTQKEYMKRYLDLSPQYQPNGRLSRELLLENIAKAFSEDMFKFEWLHQNLKGDPIPTEITLVRVRYKNGYMVACYTRDLREVKAMLKEIHKVEEDLCAARDEALANSRTKSEFLAKMSHEIRTPMNAIVGFLELILREQISPTAKEYATTIKQASRNLLSIINDILDLSKIESGKLVIEAEKYELPSVVNDVINIISMKLIDKPILFSVYVDSILPNVLIGDEIRIKQILINLLSNAVKYTEEGHISLEICGEFTDKQELCMMIDVSDTGMGIREEDMENLFGDYAKFDIQKNKGVEGTGLGLAITYKLCKAMNGEISVESTYGEGSSFEVNLPQRFNDYHEIAQVKNPELHNILLYEPREVYARSIISSLENIRVKYSLVQNQTEFQEALERDSYSFIFFPSFLFYGTQTIVNKLSEKQNTVLPKLVAMCDYGDSMNEPDILTVNMPVYSIVLANVLNETAKPSFNDNDGQSIHIRFTAPKAKILIVDDINTNLKVAKGLMSPYNMQIEVCESGIEAINMVELNRYDAIFMDHMMPVMDGIEATKIIREFSFCKNLPIIALTANAVVGVREMFLSNGFDDFLPKPIEMRKLDEILEKWIPDSKKEKFSSKLTIDNQREIEIDGIDVKVGLSKTGGGIENYIEILNVFFKDGRKKLVEIENSLRTNDIKNYTTHVHAIKSALGSIGAVELSDAAKALELAGKSEDMDFIKSNNSVFMKELEELLQKIKQTIRTDNNVSPNDGFQVDSIMSELLILKKSLDEFDGTTMDQVIRQLKDRCKNSNYEDKIESLEQYILMCEYEKATEYIDNIVSE